MAIIEPIWFFSWRMTLLGLALGALGGAAYGTALFSGGALIGELPRGEESALLTEPGRLVLGLVLLAVFASSFGIVAGAPVGLMLGLVDGLLLGAMTLAFFRPGASGRGYRAAAGAVCAVASPLVLFADWVLHGYPDLDRVAPWRSLGGLDGIAGVDYGSDANPTEIALGVAVPWLVATLAMWWAGRKVAGWYARRYPSAPE
jgi:hypothetical protein